MNSSSNTGLGSSIDYDIDLLKRELTLRFITSYSITLTDGASVASALVTEVVFSGMGHYMRGIGSTELVTSVEPIKQDVEWVKSSGKLVMIGIGAGAIVAFGGPLIAGLLVGKGFVVDSATVAGALLLMVE